jgi:DNA-binding NtrC family response regulator
MVDDSSPTEIGAHRVAVVGRDEGRGVSLLVMSDVGVFSYPINEQRELVLGRSDEADVTIPDSKASRRHAILRVKGDVYELVDLGSTNGTIVGEGRIEPNVPVSIQLGDTVSIGDTVLVLKGVERRAAPVRVYSQEAFDARVREETERCERVKSTFALVVVQLEGESLANPLDSTSTRKNRMKENVARAERLNATLQHSTRPTDVIAGLTAGLYEVLLKDTGPERAEGIAAQLRTRLNEEGFPSRVGVACFPRDGRKRDSLEHVAKAALSDPDDVPRMSVTLETGAMAQLAPIVARVAAGTINVLILGETGVGKEVMARTLHERSPRASGPLVCFNCAALSESLLESELFGYEKGAFTGATQAKPGLLEAAEGGTVFLDEVGEMPIALQAKLLRVLEQREVLRVGSLKPRPIDVRFVGATNRDLEAEIRAGRFREDLYFRLNGFTLAIPPLRERVEEIGPLARAFVAQACATARRPSALAIAPQVMALFRRYRWPGNIRELRNVVERAVLLCGEGTTITLEHVPVEKMGSVLPARDAVPASSASPRLTFTSEAPETTVKVTNDRLQEMLRREAEKQEEERRRIIETLEACHGNQTLAAKILGVSRRTLISRMEQFALPRPRKGRDPQTPE